MWVKEMPIKKSWVLLAKGVLVAIGLLFGCAHGSDARMNNGYFTGIQGRLEQAVESDDPGAIEQALAAGAAINARGIHNITPLMLAVDRMKRRAVGALLARGANPNLKAADGASAVSLAVANYRAAPDIMFALFKNGGDPNTRGPGGDPVIMRFINDRSCDYLQQMKNFGADLNITTRAGDPIITDAAMGNDWDVVWCLIELGAKYDYENTDGALSSSLADNPPFLDSPIYPYAVKVWHFLKDHGIAVQPLPDRR